MLPLIVGAVAAGFGLVIGYLDAKSGFGMKMLSFAFELCMQSMAFTLPTALLYAAAAKLFKLRYTAAGILLSVIVSCGGSTDCDHHVACRCQCGGVGSRSAVVCHTRDNNHSSIVGGGGRGGVLAAA